jgi:hypothetical protein
MKALNNFATFHVRGALLGGRTETEMMKQSTSRPSAFGKTELVGIASRVWARRLDVIDADLGVAVGSLWIEPLSSD